MKIGNVLFALRQKMKHKIIYTNYLVIINSVLSVYLNGFRILINVQYVNKYHNQNQNDDVSILIFKSWSCSNYFFINFNYS